MVSEDDSAIQYAIRSILKILDSKGIDVSGVNIDADVKRDRQLILEHMDLSEIRGSLGSFYPDLIQEWDAVKNGVLTPFKVTAYSSQKVWWLCSNHKHSWCTAVENRTRKNSGCPFCSGYYASTGFNDLATVSPLVASEWDYSKNGSLTPYNVTRGSNKKVHWVCKKGHPFEATINSRTGANVTDCTKCVRDFKLVTALHFHKEVLGIRFSWGSRYVDVSIDYLEQYGVYLDLKNKPITHLEDVNGSLITKDEYEKFLYVLDMSGNIRVIRLFKYYVEKGVLIVL